MQNNSGIKKIYQQQVKNSSVMLITLNPAC